MNTKNSQRHVTSDHKVTFRNATANVTLSGTLSVPPTPHKPPAVILIAGMGPHDRDCTQTNGQKLFELMAHYLTQHGIAVLRYDKRGIGKSKGIFKETFTFDLAQDVLAAVQFLTQRSDIDTRKIGLVGHSEGGLISFIAAAQCTDISFIVSMAGGVVTDIEEILEPTAQQFRVSGANEDFIEFDQKIRRQILEAITTEPFEYAQKMLPPLVKKAVESMTSQQKAEAAKIAPFAITEQNYQSFIDTVNSRWRVYLTSAPLKFISKIMVPVLAINSELDFIVPAQFALPIIARGLEQAGNKDVTLISLPYQNHVFQKCETGSISEYATITESIHESTLKLIADWIRETTKSIAPQ